MTIWSFVTTSFRDPAGMARALVGWRLGGGTLWSMLVLVIVLSVLVLEAGLMLSPSEAAVILISPFGLCLILGASLVMLAVAVQWTGRMFGGSGGFKSALLLMIWWQALALVIQLVQTATLLIAPSLSGIVALAGLAWMVFALLHLVNVLHGFHSLLKALGTVAIGVFGISFVTALLLGLAGVTVQGGTG